MTHASLRPYRPEDRDALFDICIDLLPSHQRYGYGRRLMETFLDALHARGVPAVHLSMLTSNTPARAFYDRVGFHEIAVPDPGPVTYLGRSTAATPPR
ncbi:GNAT family N-acetyltransferase [Streptomyces cyaneofuscatus]